MTAIVIIDASDHQPRAAEGGDLIEAARELFLEYAREIEIDLCFQNFEKELAGLPGAYARPDGRLLLAMDADAPAACVALRKIGDGICEMKRLYVRPTRRGQNLGRRLAERVIDEALTIGYRRMRLDTLTTMQAAIALYESLGFVRTDPYYHNPLPDVVYFEKLLAGGAW